ncbi:MAG: hypothetical protein PHD76_11110 [Methylacidiphilales bacterium]|nr:hypothetical protein [Candidatus Methylacidiphilales bacterium]
MKHSFLGLVFFCAAAGLLQAQNQSAIQQYQNTQQQQEQFNKIDATQKGEKDKEAAPELYPGENKDVGPQLLVRAVPRRQWIEATADSQYYYTSNVFLAKETAPGSRSDTGVMVSTAQVALAPDPFDLWGGKVSPRIGFRYQWYNYGMDRNDNQDLPNGLNSLDFDAQTAFADVRYQFLKDWIFTMGADFTRLVSHEPPLKDYHEFYKEAVPHFGLERLFTVSDNSAVSLAYTNYIHITDSTPAAPSSYSNNRMENAVTLSYTQQVIEHLILQPYFRFQYDNYISSSGPGSNGSRMDLGYSTGLTAAYYFNNWASIRSFFTYDTRATHGLTNSSIYDYEVYNGGVGADMTFRF